MRDLDRRVVALQPTIDKTVFSHVQGRFETRARALFYARLALMAVGLVALLVPAWRQALGIQLPAGAYWYLLILAYHVGSYLWVGRRYSRIIVFASLTVISLLIRLIKNVTAKKKRKQQTEDTEVPVRNGVSGEVVAAIATALQHHLFELHDEERTIITIKKVSKSYSPWSSKLYGMTPSPFKQISKP